MTNSINSRDQLEYPLVVLPLVSHTFLPLNFAGGYFCGS